jgi:WD40 repeat protein
MHTPRTASIRTAFAALLLVFLLASVQAQEPLHIRWMAGAGGTGGGHTGFAFWPDEHSLATTTSEGTVLIYALDSGRLTETAAPGDALPAATVALSPDGDTIARAVQVSPPRISIRRRSDPSFLVQIPLPQPYPQLAFSSDGSVLAWTGPDHFYLSRVTDGMLLAESSQTGIPDIIRFSPDGALIATCSYFGLNVWSATGAAFVRTLVPEAVHAFSFSADGTLIAAPVSDGTVIIRRVADGSEVFRIPRIRHQYALDAVFVPGADVIAVRITDWTIQTWNARDWTYHGELYGSEYLTDLAAAPRGSGLAYRTDDGAAYVLDALGGPATLLTLPAGAINGSAYSPADSIIVTACAGTLPRQYAADDGRLLLQPRWGPTQYMAAAFEPGGARYAAAGYRWGDASVLRTADAAWLAGYRHAAPVMSIAWSPTEPLIASGSADQTVALWSADNSLVRAVLRGHLGTVTGVAFSPDGATLVSASRDRTLRMWATADGSLLRILRGHADDVLCVAYSPSGALIASGDTTGAIRLWRAADGAPFQTIPAHTAAVRSLAFDPGGRRLISAGDDHTIRFWSLPGLVPQLVHSRETGTAVNSVSLSSDGSRLAYARRDGVLVVADTPPIPCAADADHNQMLNVQDFMAYTQAFATAAPAADFDNNGLINIQDFLAFLQAFAAGC